MYVTQVTNWVFTVMDGTYQGLFGYQSVYRVIANAHLNASRNGVLSAAVQQDVGLEAIPIFQFAIFYNMDLEMNPSPAMVVSGRVHAQREHVHVTFDIAHVCQRCHGDRLHHQYLQSGRSAGQSRRRQSQRHFPGPAHAGHRTLNLPLGNSTNANAILQAPPVGESPTSPTGATRMYNQADLLVLVTDSGVKITSGVPEGSGVTVSSAAWTNFLVITNTIYNKRESMNVRALQFNVANFKTWAESATNPITPLLTAKSAINIVYIADLRTPIATAEPGVELFNGSQLPRAGLTVASPDPVYIRGDYNTTSDGVHYSKRDEHTTYTLPAASWRTRSWCCPPRGRTPTAACRWPAASPRTRPSTPRC